MKKIKYLIIALLLLITTGCVFNTPFYKKYKIEYANPNETFHTPAGFFAVDEDGNIVDLEGVTFTQNKTNIKFSNFKKSEPDKDGYVIISYDTEMSVDIDFKATKQEERWYYSCSFNSPMLYDAYTGTILNQNMVSDGNENGLSFQNGELVENKKEFKDNVIKYGGKEYHIGIYYISYGRSYDGGKDLGTEDGATHIKDKATEKTTRFIKVPKDYDGLTLVVNKKGSSVEYAKETAADAKKYRELLKKYEETGKKSKELEEIEKNSGKYHKLVDPSDEVRKEFTAEDYYHINVSETVGMKSNTSNKKLLVIIGVVAVIVLIITIIIAVILGVVLTKKNKTPKKKTTKVEVKDIKEEKHEEVKKVEEKKEEKKVEEKPKEEKKEVKEEKQDKPKKKKNISTKKKSTKKTTSKKTNKE